MSQFVANRRKPLLVLSSARTVKVLGFAFEDRVSLKRKAEEGCSSAVHYRSHPWLAVSEGE